MLMLAITLTLAPMMLIALSPFLMIPSILLLVSIYMFIYWVNSSSPWAPLVFVLAFLGGLMIMFMYVVSTMQTKMLSQHFKMSMIFSILPIAFFMNMTGMSTPTVELTLMSFNSFYFILCFLIVMILLISSKVINSPFKSLKGGF